MDIFKKEKMSFGIIRMALNEILNNKKSVQIGLNQFFLE